MRIFIYLNLYTYFCLGFIFGNLFGNFIYFLKLSGSNIGNIIAIILAISIFELLTFVVQIQFSSDSFKKLNAIRIGLLIGIYLDAFKVGS